ncbi:hypothetical protein SAURM35S_03875 [Streptomyces aurantiogriseus]
MAACHTASSSSSPQIRAKGLHSIIPLTSVDMSAVCREGTRLVAWISMQNLTGGPGWGDLVESAVVDQGPQDVDSAAGEGDHGLGMAFALGALAVVKRPGVGGVAHARQGGHVEDALEPPVVVAAGAGCRSASGIVRCRSQTGERREPPAPRTAMSRGPNATCCTTISQGGQVPELSRVTSKVRRAGAGGFRRSRCRHVDRWCQRMWCCFQKGPRSLPVADWAAFLNAVVVETPYQWSCAYRLRSRAIAAAPMVRSRSASAQEPAV